MSNSDIGGPFRNAHHAALQAVKQFVLLKNTNGKLSWISLLLFTVGIIIATGRFEVLVFSAVVGVIITFGFYLLCLDYYLKKEPVFQKEKKNDTFSASQQKDE